MNPALLLLILGLSGLAGVVALLFGHVLLGILGVLLAVSAWVTWRRGLNGPSATRSWNSHNPTGFTGGDASFYPSPGTIAFSSDDSSEGSQDCSDSGGGDSGGGD